MKHIWIIAGSHSTKERLVEQLVSLLEGQAVIHGLAVDENGASSIWDGIGNGIHAADLVIYSSETLWRELCRDSEARICPSPSIIARRTIDVSNLDRLFALRRGTRVLLVNDTRESAEESVSLLKLLGIDHLHYVPWCPSDGDGALGYQEVAVTPGEAELVPQGIAQVIDLGTRIIDLSTVLEILHALDMPESRFHYVSALYMQTVVRMGNAIHKSMENMERLSDRLGETLHRMNDGLLAFDEDERIRVFSQRCETIFGIRSDAAMGRKLASVIKDEVLMAFLREKGESLEVLMGFGGQEYAVSSFFSDKSGWKVCTIRSLDEATELAHKRKRQLLQKGHFAKYNAKDIIHVSGVMEQALRTVSKIAAMPLAILIQGESGTGKELFASAIHNLSQVKDGPFVAVNFSALPEELMESELFGYEEGAFTGARKGGRIGLFEQANGGTLFLDEIGDISVKMQARLLRVLQEKEVMRVGGTSIIPVDVRVIAATNKPLLVMCGDGRFREDLYYRLRRLYLKTPSLRERPEDIPVLVDHFLKKLVGPGLIADRAFEVAPALMECLMNASWRGNVRELESVVEHMVAVSEGHVLTCDDLPQDFLMEGIANESVVKESVHGFKRDLSASAISTISAGVLPLQFRSEDYRFILRTILEHVRMGRTIGREAITRYAHEKGIPLTEDQVRHRLRLLVKAGILEGGKGRRGAVLTEKGRSMAEVC